MTRSSKEIKRISRDILNDRYGVPMGAFVLASVIPMAVELPFSMSSGNNPSTSQLVITLFAEIIITLISFLLSTGVSLVHLNMTRNQTFKATQIFAPFRQRTECYFGAGVLLLLLFLAASLPLIGGVLLFYYLGENITGIVILVCAILISVVLYALVLLNYNFVGLLLLDHPQFGVINCFRECRLMMKGNKGRLLYVLLSFIGWDLLIVCSLGLAALWISPYRNQTMVTFYLDCTGELDSIPVRQYL